MVAYLSKAVPLDTNFSIIGGTAAKCLQSLCSGVCISPEAIGPNSSLLRRPVVLMEMHRHFSTPGSIWGLAQKTSPKKKSAFRRKLRWWARRDLNSYTLLY